MIDTTGIEAEQTPEEAMAELNKESAGVRLTEAKPAAGVYTLGGGYVEDLNGQPVLHREVQIRELGGEEEELLANDGVKTTARMTAVMAAATDRIGTIVEKGGIARAIRRLPSGDRSMLVILLRRVALGDVYSMEVECPFAGKCGKTGMYDINLAELDVYTMEDPMVREFHEELPSGRKARWKVATGVEEDVFAAVSDLAREQILSYGIAMRLVTLDGNDVQLVPSDVYDPVKSKLKLQKKGREVIDIVRKMTLRDRDYLREQFFQKEPGVDTDLQIECKFCHKDFEGRLDVSQPGFFFRSVTSKRRRTKSDS